MKKILVNINQHYPCAFGDADGKHCRRRGQP